MGATERPDAGPDERPITTIPIWTGPDERPLLGWLSVPDGATPGSGVVLIGPLGYEWFGSHRTWRRLAERLAAAGHAALRLDLDGTADSAGGTWDAGRVDAWRASVGEGVARLRRAGCARVVLAGARVGATLAYVEAPAAGVDEVAMWAPVASGRRWAREQRLLGTAATAEDPTVEGAISVAGSGFTPATLDDLARLSIAADAHGPRRVALVDGAVDDGLAARLEATGATVARCVVADARQPLESSAERAGLSEGVVAAIADWVGPGAPSSGAPAPAPHSASASLAWRAGRVTERVGWLGAAGLVAIETTDAASDGGPTLLFLNTGSEPHVGPGRAWVELARDLALRGYRCVRADWRGWGESPYRPGDVGPGRPYDANAFDDTLALVAALREQRHDPIHLVGICASAYVALQAAPRIPDVGIIAVSPQLYWVPGDPVDELIGETTRKRLPRSRREERGRRLGAWDVLDRLGHRPPAARMLDALRVRSAPVTLLSGPQDPGMAFLHRRVGRRLAALQRSGAVTVRVVADFDHALHDVRARRAALEEIERAVPAGR